ncbi:MAG TPA: hypothetical protein VGE06_11500, partial [Flavisolibacter sp.]
APKKYLLAVFSLFCFVAIACSQRNNNDWPAAVFVGSTPCDAGVKTMLQIPAGTACDFIRWTLTIGTGSEDSSYQLTLTYGESQPNTLGFKNGGEKRTYKGRYACRMNNNGRLKGEVFLFLPENAFEAISLLKLNENLLHLLTPAGNLMTGNGGWSYTLNRDGQNAKTTPSPIVISWSAMVKDTSTQVIYDGRTPCQDFAAEHQMNVRSSCFKLKWQLVLNRDAVSHEPTTYTLRKIMDNEPRNVTGKWQAVRGVPGNANALVYELDPDKPNESISLLVGDENVLFFLNHDRELYVGNGDFSFTLNKRP